MKQKVSHNDRPDPTIEQTQQPGGEVVFSSQYSQYPASHHQQQSPPTSPPPPPRSHPQIWKKTKSAGMLYRAPWPALVCPRTEIGIVNLSDQQGHPAGSIL